MDLPGRWIVSKNRVRRPIAVIFGGLRREIRCHFRADGRRTYPVIADVERNGMRGFHGHPRTVVEVGVGSYGVPVRQMRAAMCVAWCLWSRYRLASIAQRAYNNPLKLWHEAQMVNQSAQWSEASDVIPMFPTLVWKIELEAQLREAIGARVLATLAHLRRDLPPLAPGQGWQSVQSLHELDEFRDLVSCVHRIVPGILDSSESVTTCTKSPPAGR